MDYPRYHLHCGGKLNFAKTEVVTVVINKRAVEKYNAKAIIKQFNKDLYKCDKCDEFINVVIFPSWEEYVLMGKIRVAKWKYWKIKDAHRAMQQKMAVVT